MLRRKHRSPFQRVGNEVDNFTFRECFARKENPPDFRVKIASWTDHRRD